MSAVKAQSAEQVRQQPDVIKSESAAADERRESETRSAVPESAETVRPAAAKPERPEPTPAGERAQQPTAVETLMLPRDGRAEAEAKDAKAEKRDAAERKITEGIERAKARFADRQTREAEEKRRQEAEIDRQRKERQAAEKRAREMALEQKREEERSRGGGWSR